MNFERDYTEIILCVDKLYLLISCILVVISLKEGERKCTHLFEKNKH